MSEPQPRIPLLVVDDDDAVRKLIERIAIRAGFDVHGARDGLQAMELLDRNEYDIVVVDLMMPRVSGYELVQKIGTMTRRPAVIVATAMTNGDVARLDDSMIRRVIRKPFDITAVSKTLHEVAEEIGARIKVAAPTEPIVIPAEEETPPPAPEPPIDKVS